MNNVLSYISTLLTGQTLIHLVTFDRGGILWHFTTQPEHVEHKGIVYKALNGFKIPNILDENVEKCEIELSMSQINDFKNDDGKVFDIMFYNMIFIESVTVKIMEVKGSNELILFTGRVSFPDFDEEVQTLTLNCTTAERFVSRNVLTRKFQSSCANTIFDRFCGLRFEDWAIELEVTQITNEFIKYDVVPTQVVIDGIPQFEQIQATDEFGELLYELKQSEDEFGNLLYEQKPKLDENGEPELDENGEPIFEDDLTKPIMEPDLDKPIMIDGPPIMEVKVYPEHYFDDGVLQLGGTNVHVISNTVRTLQLYAPSYVFSVGDIVKCAPGCDQTQSGKCNTFFNNADRAHVFMTVPNENPVYANIMK